MATRVGYVTVAMIVVLAFASFALPLVGIHRVLVGENGSQPLPLNRELKPGTGNWELATGSW